MKQKLGMSLAAMCYVVRMRSALALGECSSAMSIKA
jgi:hypothetical protein